MYDYMLKGTLRPFYNKATYDRKLGSFYLKIRRKGVVNTIHGKAMLYLLCYNR